MESKTISPKGVALMPLHTGLESIVTQGYLADHTHDKYKQHTMS